MVSVVPSLEGSLFLKDPQSIIAYQMRKYFRTPKDTVPILGDEIISLPWVVAEFGKEPDTLTSTIRSDLQKCFDRIFAGERQVSVNTNFTMVGESHYEVTISVTYSQISGEISQTGTTITLRNGRLTIPEDQIKLPFM